MRKVVLTFAPHTYLTKDGKGGYLLSVIIPVIRGKKIIFDPINHMVSKTKIVGHVIDDASSIEDYSIHVFEIKASLLTPLRKKVEVIIHLADEKYKSCDKYEDSDDDAFDVQRGVAVNCPHSFLGKEQEDTFFPKAIVVLDGYEYRGEIDIIRTSPENGICECTVKLHRNTTVNNDILVFNDLNSLSYNDQGVTSDSNSLVFTYLIDNVNAATQNNGGVVAMDAAGGPIKKRKTRKRNGTL